jgi:hypothetical protein
MKKYSLIEIEFGHPSFSWGNGRYIIVGEGDNGIRIDICRINDNKPDRFEDGRFIVSSTGKKNSGIKDKGGFMIEIGDIRLLKY